MTGRIARIEECHRRNNVVIPGIKASTHTEPLAHVQEMIWVTVKKPMDVENVRLIKQMEDTPKIVVSCKFFEDKLERLSPKSDFPSQDGNPIYVNDDLTKDQSRLQF